MAAIIDGVTYSGYWKYTADDASPNDFYVIPKKYVYLDTVTSALVLLTDPTAIAFSMTVNTSTKDHTGTALGSLDAIANYLELYR